MRALPERVHCVSAPMTAIIKTWPASFTRKHVLEVFNHDWCKFYFTLGRGKPKQEPQELWYTHRGQILGHFVIGSIIRNLGTNIPPLKSITGETSAWQIALMNW